MIDTKNPCYGCDTGWGQADCTGTVKSCRDECKRYREYKRERPLKVKYRDTVGDLLKLECDIDHTAVCIGSDGSISNKTFYAYKLEIRDGDKRICYDKAELADIEFI